MFYNNKIVFADDHGEKVFIEPGMANRHGLIAGATGTGKTITLKVLAESFSDAGVPVLITDVKGDLTGMIEAGSDSEDMQERIRKFSLADMNFSYKAYPAAFWDLYGENGIPVRTTISEMGPVLLAKLLDLNETQTAVLSVVFKIADDQKLLLIDIKDLKSMLTYVSDNSKELSQTYGNMAKQSINAILRSVIALESKGADLFFGEPALNVSDWFASGTDGRGMMNILDCRQLMQDSTMYSAFLMWFLSELFETLPEVGDMDKPRMVFFFDEAHLLFKDCSKAFEEKIEQVVKLIRSKGVGIFFCTQNPTDLPDGILSQLGNKIQHALRAYTPNDEKALKAAAGAFRANPDFDTRQVLQELGTGEALVSVLDKEGIPTVVRRCSILPPQSRMGAAGEEAVKQVTAQSNLYLKYKESSDRDSAYEFLERMKQQNAAEAESAKQQVAAEKEKQKAEEKKEKEKQKEKEREERQRKNAAKSIGSTVAGTIGREVGSTIGKSVGGSFGRKLGANLGAALGRNIMGTFFKSR
ncbi:MAG: helicase HerA-like domain-containing protein [Lachnospiraceae bacterium]|jgi:DNA helicase HerA-like ATPase